MDDKMSLKKTKIQVSRGNTVDIEKMAVIVFCVLCGIVMTALFINSMRASWINELVWEEVVTERDDDLCFNLAGMAIGLVFVYALSCLAEKIPIHIKMDMVAAIIGIICVAVSAYWVTVTETRPEADQRDIVEYAKAYANGDTSSLQKGGYVANYPQQLGLITFMRVLFKVWGEGNYKAYQYFNACMVFLIVYAGYKIVVSITRDNRKAEWMYLLFLLCCVPVYGYTPFVYGEIASVALTLTAVWLMLSMLENFSRMKLVLLAITCGAMVQFRKNTLICVIAFLIVIFVKMLKKPGKELMMICGSILIGTAVFQGCVSAIYAPYIPDDAEPIPALVYVAMGTRYTPGLGAGWHDGYDVKTHQKSGYDAEKSNEAARQQLREFAKICAADPQQFFLFYDMKINSQWNAPLYQCLVMNSSFYGAPRGIANKICFQGGDRYLEGFMEIYQLLIYGGALSFLICYCRRKDPVGIEVFILMICVYGGFLFSVIWEAKTRYVFPYFVFLIPCAVAGITELCDKINVLKGYINTRLK